VKRSGSRFADPEPATPASPARLLLDTNALMLVATRRLSLETELARLGLPRPRVTRGVRNELDRLIHRGVPDAVLAQRLADRYAVLEDRGRGDAGLLATARRTRAAVLTADRRFASRLRSAGVPVLAPRATGRLAWVPARPASSARRRPVPGNG
jgi:rRNA-processing protein FCF1